MSHHLIGHAGRIATKILDRIHANRTAGQRPAWKLAFLGDPGIGKSHTARLLAHELAQDKLNIRHLNGTELTLDVSRDIAQGFAYKANLLGDYRVIWVDEIDRASRAAQIDLLTLLDKLPEGFAFIVTSNEPRDYFEERFITRFHTLEFEPPAPSEIIALLRERHGLNRHAAAFIANTCAGNVRAAFAEAETQQLLAA